MPIQDNLQYLWVMIEQHLNVCRKGTIEIEALLIFAVVQFQPFIIIDECQNLSAHEIKTIITALVKKIVFTGDIEQIDNV